MSAPEGKTDVPREPEHFRFGPNSDIATAAAAPPSTRPRSTPLMSSRRRSGISKATSYKRYRYSEQFGGWLRPIRSMFLVVRSSELLEVLTSVKSCYRTPANRTNAKELPPCGLPGVKRTCSALVVTSDSDPPLMLPTSTHPQSAAGSRSCRDQTQRWSSRSREHLRIFPFRQCIE